LRDQKKLSGFELVGSEWEWMSGNGQEVPGCATLAYQLLGWCPPLIP
jgi:hypothetical protein